MVGAIMRGTRCKLDSVEAHGFVVGVRSCWQNRMKDGRRLDYDRRFLWRRDFSGLSAGS